MTRPIKKLIILKCFNCGKKFKKYPSQIKLSKKIFCGNYCVINYRRMYSKEKIIRKCMECNLAFKIYKSALKKCKSAGRYCSRNCASKRKIIINCEICNKKFKCYKSDLERSNKRFCSIKCYNKRTNPLDHFLSNISYKKNKLNCLNWTGRKDQDGYGIMFYNKKSFKAHRFSYLLYNGKIPKKKIICHKCDNRSCINPIHIYAGTAADNGKDRKNKNRHKI